VSRQGRRPYQNGMQATSKDRAGTSPVGAGVPKLSHNYYPTRDRATITKASHNWVAPTSYVGVAQRQEAMTIRHRRYYLYASHVLHTRIASCAFGTGTYDVPATHRGTICPLARLLRQFPRVCPYQSLAHFQGAAGWHDDISPKRYRHSSHFAI
jgi:hypothetical protein